MEQGSALCRFSWAERYPLQARTLGTRFDESGKPIWFAPPPEQVLERLTPSQRQQIFSGSLAEHISRVAERARPHASDPPHDMSCIGIKQVIRPE